MVVVTTLNDKEAPWATPALLDPSLLTLFSDVDVVAAGSTFRAHRAVLAAHSAFFRALFLAPPPVADQLAELHLAHHVARAEGHTSHHHRQHSTHEPRQQHHDLHHEASHSQHQVEHTSRPESPHEASHEVSHEAHYDPHHAPLHAAHHESHHESHHETHHQEHHGAHLEAQHEAHHEAHHDLHHDPHDIPHHAAYHEGHHDAHHDAHHEAQHETHHEAHHDPHHAPHHDAHQEGHHEEHYEAHHDPHHAPHQAAHQEGQHEAHHEAHHDSQHEAQHETHHQAHHDPHHSPHYVAHHEAHPEAHYEAHHEPHHEAHHETHHASHCALPHDIGHASHHDVHHEGHTSHHLEEGAPASTQDPILMHSSESPACGIDLPLEQRPATHVEHARHDDPQHHAAHHKHVALEPSHTASSAAGSEDVQRYVQGGSPIYPVYQPPPVPRKRVHIHVDNIAEDVIRTGWDLIYRYCYGLRVPLEASTALAALQVSTVYRFDDLSAVLHTYLRGGGVDPLHCTRVFAAAAAASRTHVGRPGVMHVVRAAAWRVMKHNFPSVSSWHLLPLPYMVRLLKLNDLQVSSETDVFRAVQQWVSGDPAASEPLKRDPGVVAALVKLVRFPTMTAAELRSAQESSLVTTFPAVSRYVRRGIAAQVNDAPRASDDLREVSPVYRRRRMDALTFSDRVASWSSVTNAVHTSARYFAGALWHLVVDPSPDGGVTLYLGVLSEESAGPVDIEVDFALFLVAQADTEVEMTLVRKQARRVRFSRSGQRAGFANLVRKEELEELGTRVLRHDTLFIGTSIRLQGCKGSVAGMDAFGDDTAEMLTF